MILASVPLLIEPYPPQKKLKLLQTCYDVKQRNNRVEFSGQFNNLDLSNEVHVAFMPRRRIELENKNRIALVMELFQRVMGSQVCWCRKVGAGSWISPLRSGPA